MKYFSLKISVYLSPAMNINVDSHLLGIFHIVCYCINCFACTCILSLGIINKGAYTNMIACFFLCIRFKLIRFNKSLSDLYTLYIFIYTDVFKT